MAYIQKVSFELASAELAIKKSALKVTQHELYESGTEDPAIHGIYDKHLGTTEYLACKSCLKDKDHCSGHTGHYNLKYPVQFSIAVKEINKWLKITCSKCGCIILPADKYEDIPNKMAMIAKIKPGTLKCWNCPTVHPKFVKDKDDRFSLIEVVGDKKTKLYPQMILERFERITDETVSKLGRKVHPRFYFTKTIIIPPNNIRPGIKNYNSSFGSHADSTIILHNIIKLDRQLPDNIFTLNTSSDEFKNGVKNIQVINQQYYDLTLGSSSTSIMQGSTGKQGIVIGSRAIKSFLRGLSGKKERIRQNLLGCRVFNIYRSTISGDPNLRVDQIGISLECAKILQIEETVQEFNRERLGIYFRNGRSDYPGSTYLTKSEGGLYDVDKITNYELSIGDKLMRDVITGDKAYFNRAPTLEKSSTTVVEIVVFTASGHTIRMNVLLCKLFGADFDGDAMVLWVPRGVMQRIEAEQLSSVGNMFISIKTSAPSICQVQDSVIGNYLLTRDCVKMNKYSAMGMYNSLEFDYDFADYEASHIFTGRDVISMLLKDVPVNLTKTPASYDDAFNKFVDYPQIEQKVIIRNGILQSGVLDGSTLGTSNGGLYHLISREHGIKAACDTIYTMQQLSLKYLIYGGTTVSMSDLILSKTSIKEIHNNISALMLESQLLTDRLKRGEIIAPIGMTVAEYYEASQKAIMVLDDSRMLEQIFESISPTTNGIFHMIATGSKGKKANLLHVSSCIGQIELDMLRMKESFSFARTSPYFQRFSHDPRARGFVTNSYVSGMNSAEFIFQDMTNRFDLFTKAFSTGVTGFFTRVATLNTQSCVIDNLRRLTKYNSILQFIYGEDGVDATMMEFISLDFAYFDNLDLDNKQNTDFTENSKLSANQMKLILSERDKFRKIIANMSMRTIGNSLIKSLLMPVNPKRIIESVFVKEQKNEQNSEQKGEAKSSKKSNTKSDLESKLKFINDNIDKLPYVHLNAIMEYKQSKIPEHLIESAALLIAVTRFELRPSIADKLTLNQLKFILDIIKLKYSLSLVSYGTAIGNLAVQTITEILNQYMLDSHHRSVGSTTNQSVVIRSNEIYVGKTESNPKMELRLDPSIKTKMEAQSVANAIEYIQFGKLLKQYDVLLEPRDVLICPEFIADKTWIAAYINSHPLIRVSNALTNWCLRFQLDQTTLILKGLSLEYIIMKLKTEYDHFIVHTDPVSDPVIIRIWLKSSPKHEIVIEDILDEFLKLPMRGLPRITYASVTTKKFYDDNLKASDEFVIVTNGTNISDCLKHKKISYVNSTSIPDTLKMFGIEAARSKIINETISLFSDKCPNVRHVLLFADSTTYSGKIIPMTKTGLERSEPKNTLLHMAFSAPIPAITKAALGELKCPVYGIAAHSMNGSIPRIGTLYNEIVVNSNNDESKSLESQMDEL